MELKFFRCRHCGNVVVKFVDSGVSLFCCGSPMDTLSPATEDEGMEKHLPMLTRIDDRTLEVQVGSTPHPMTEQHSIQFISLETEKGIQTLWLNPGDAPKAIFYCASRPVAVYEYCNIHGLWKTIVK